MKKATFVINSFQTPNAIIDKLMELLTDSELRVLMYATRHILGWQHKAESKQAIISLSNFQNGFKYTAEDGEVFEYSGTGLGRGTILKALEGLVEYKILSKVGEPSAIGQKWKLRFMVKDDVNIEGLISRQDALKNKRKTQTDKARRSVQQTTDSQSVQQTDVVSSTNQAGLSNRLNERPSKDHSKDQPLSAPKTAQGAIQDKSEDDTPKHKSKKERDLLFDTIALESFGFKEGTRISKPSGARIGMIAKYIRELETDVTPRMMQDFYKQYDFNNDGAVRPKDVKKFATHFDLFLQEPTSHEPQLTVVPKFDVTSEDETAAQEAFKHKPVFGASS